MNSLPFPIGKFNPINNPTTTTKRNSQTVQSSAAVKFTKSKPPISLSRRETLGIGFGFSFLHLIEPALAQNDAAPPCEFTAAPSGLAYCDKLVGNGSEAVQGQLIKAHYVGKLEDGTVFDSSYNRGKPLTFRVGVGEVVFGQGSPLVVVYSFSKRDCVSNDFAKEKRIAALSTTITEYIAMADDAKEGSWLKGFNKELAGRDVCMKLHCDYHLSAHERTKYIDGDIILFEN